MMFKRKHHQLIAQVLTVLDGNFLAEHQCLFGGGTALALCYGEYRQSVDIDLVVSDVASYREIRLRTAGESGVLNLMAAHQGLVAQLKPVRADQYGIRTTLSVQNQPIKFEIILEGRIDLDPPTKTTLVCGVPRLSEKDLVATKLLANSDRHADRGTFQRDLIDLAMMAPSKNILDAGKRKAEQAYGEAISLDIHKASAALESRDGWLDRCLEHLQIELPKAVVWDSLRRFKKRFRSLASSSS